MRSEKLEGMVSGALPRPMIGSGQKSEVSGALPRRRYAWLWCVAVLMVVCGARGTDVTLGWDANVGTATAGYRIHVGSATRQYNASLDAGLATSLVVSNLDEAGRYYFAATAYDTNGVESDFSDEAYWHGTRWVPPDNGTLLPPVIKSITPSQPWMKVHVRNYALFSGTNAAAPLTFARNVSFDLYLPATNAATFYSLEPEGGGGTNRHPPIVATLLK